MNDLSFVLKETEVDIYADDTIIWSSGTNILKYNKPLNRNLGEANRWFKLIEMKPNTKKTKHLLIGIAKNPSNCERLL